MKKKEIEIYLEELKEELDNLLEQEETEEIRIRYCTLSRVYKRLKFIMEQV